MAEPKKPPPLSPELLKYFQGLAAPAQRQTSGSQYERDGFMPVYDTNWSSSPESAAGTQDQPGSLLNIVGPGFNPKDPNNHAAYDKDTGEFSHWYTANTGISPEMAFALALGGLAFIPGGLASTLSGAAGGAGGAGGAAAGGFNAAVDSQLANLALGSETLGGYTGAAELMAGAEGASSLFGGVAADTALPAAVFNPAMDSQLANLAFDAQYGAGSSLGGYGVAGSAPQIAHLTTIPGNTTGIGELSGGLLGEGTPNVFNAAKDSQLANIGPDVTSPLSGYQAAGATPSAVNLGSAASSGNWLDNLLPKGVSEALGGAKGIGGLVGAALGAASSKDQEATSTKDPWGPAQPWIKDNIAKGQDLQKYYEASPFNDLQKQGLQGLLDANATGRQALPGLLDFANRLGQTNYQRSGGRNLAYSAPSGAAPASVGFRTASAPALDWAAMNPFTRKA